MFKFRGRLLYLIIPFLFFITPVGNTEPYQPDAQDTTYELWLKDHEQIITILLALSVPISGWLLSNYFKKLERQKLEKQKQEELEKEAGRQQFLAQATVAITDSVSERLVAKLELLEERIEWIYKEISNFENKLHTTDNEINQIRLELSRLITDVKVLRATRREFLHRLNEQLLEAEKHLADVINNAGSKEYVARIEPIKDPFDSSAFETLF